MVLRSPELHLLVSKVEVKFGGMPETPRDFVQLSEAIRDFAGAVCSSSTLRRIWGYDSYDGNTRRSTLDVLSKYIGYKDFRQFCKAFRSEAQGSGFIGDGVIYADTLKEGDRLQLKWAPNRTVVIRCLGDRTFEVESSENSKLMKGDKFAITVIAKGYPVFLTAFFRGGKHQPSYVAASNLGISEVTQL